LEFTHVNVLMSTLIPNRNRSRERLLEFDKIPKLFFHPAEDYGPNER
jgi:hypothetical protein